MPIITERKPFKHGDSIVVSLPAGHTMAEEEHIMMIANNVILMYPKNMEPGDVRDHAEELVKVIK